MDQGRNVDDNVVQFSLKTKVNKTRFENRSSESWPILMRATKRNCTDKLGPQEMHTFVFKIPLQQLSKVRAGYKQNHKCTKTESTLFACYI